ncbi:hypothetical protein DPEC_G00268090 [Dallia pectoralis]|uniref:Uncharacterized protein n=1 Tax=Dallia pectoralis TaxID=75939 RepID=A0ACC2FNZ2_DALPE|nr:hypothetical protein DPEC_G00268090 [Dallia pectoralis]
MDQPCGPDRESEPPTLPIKQCRSLYSSGSSVSSYVDLELDSSVSSPLGIHPSKDQNFTDVFFTATDCHARQCPIHQRYDPSYGHQERFFSDGTTPPPVPKKSLTRTMSLPGVHLCPRSTTIMQSLSQLNFDTPDKQLFLLLSSVLDQGGLSRSIQHCHLLFLRSMTRRLEDRVLLIRESVEGAGPFQPKDFLLFENNPPIQIAGSLYYSLHTPKCPARIMAAKVNSDVPPISRPHLVPPHVNIQQVIISFPACSALHKDPEPKTIPSNASQSKTETELAHGGSIEADRSGIETNNMDRPVVVSLLHMGYTVTVERDLPQATLEGFVDEGRLLHSSEPLVYERQLSILLLQLALGLQHLLSNAATCAHLRANNILLSSPSIQVWLGALLEYCLHLTDSASGQHTHSSDDTSQRSPYSPGLRKLALWLQNGDRGLQIAEIPGFLQAALWGPREEFFRSISYRLPMLQNWLSVKQALLLLKLAERGLVQDLQGLDWEYYLCLKYISFTDSEMVMRTIERLGLHN